MCRLRDGMLLLVSYSAGQRLAFGRPNPLLPLDSRLHPPKVTTTPVIVLQVRDFNSSALYGSVCPTSIPRSSTTFLPYMQSHIHDGSSQARNPSVTLGFPGNRAVKPGGSVIVS